MTKTSSSPVRAQLRHGATVATNPDGMTLTNARGAVFIGLTSDDLRLDARIALHCATSALPVVPLGQQRSLAVSVLSGTASSPNSTPPRHTTRRPTVQHRRAAGRRAFARTGVGPARTGRPAEAHSGRRLCTRVPRVGHYSRSREHIVPYALQRSRWKTVR